MIVSEVEDVDGRPVERHELIANGEVVTLIRAGDVEPEILIGGTHAYSLEGARRLRDALSELLALAER